MNKFLCLLALIVCLNCNGQPKELYSLEFTNDLKEFTDLSQLKTALESVEIIALGENTHGLGEVFKTKQALVQFLHEELDFNILLFESGYADAALAWENLNQLSLEAYCFSFSSNYYYQSEEIKNLMDYVISQKDNPILVHGIDCQVQQDYLAQRMEAIVYPVDTLFAKSVKLNLQNFNLLYQLEHDKDTSAFYQQRDQFFQFLQQYETFLQKNATQIIGNSATTQELEILKRCFEIFKATYATIPIGGMMSWPMAYNIRDKSMFESVNWFRKQYPKEKIIIWAQNSHIENAAKPNYSVDWMGHLLRKKYAKRYYSIGAIVYSGKDLNRKEILSFQHDQEDHLAFHLEKYGKEKFLLDLKNYEKKDFLSEPLLGMESNGNKASFVAKDRFDGILFIRYSDIPQLLIKQE